MVSLDTGALHTKTTTPAFINKQGLVVVKVEHSILEWPLELVTAFESGS